MNWGDRLRREAALIKRHEIDDAEWDLIGDLLPRGPGGGRPRADPRTMLNGMMWILRTGAPWRDLPDRYGAWDTVCARFREYRKDGILDRVLERLRLRLNAEGYIDWDL